MGDDGSGRWREGGTSGKASGRVAALAILLVVGPVLVLFGVAGYLVASI